MRCAICGDEVPQIKARDKHIVIGKNFADNHIHIHGDLDNKELVKELLETAGGETGVSFASGPLELKEVVFHNRQRIGDMLMFTCAIRDFKAAFPQARVNVISTAGHIWDHNPYLDRELVATPENTVKIGPGKLTNRSNSIDWHFANAFRVSIQENLKIHIPQGESRPDIWFTEEEYNAPRIIKEPYWLIITSGEKGWGCKMYPHDRWQRFVEMNPNILFYQLGAAGDNPQRLQGKNVVDYVGKTEDKDTGIRDLFKLFLNAEGSIGLVSFHMHLSGALSKPAIIVAGGREPVSFTRYPGHQYLATDGCLPCAIKACWHCDISKCTNFVMQGDEKIPKCVDIITPDDLTRALNNYYLGGRLKKDIPSARPKLKNIVAVPKVFTGCLVSKEAQPESKYAAQGLNWGGKEITARDWEYILQIIKRHNIKSVLAFGAGLSTLLFKDAGLRVMTVETDPDRIDKIKAINPECDIRPWMGEYFGVLDEYTLGFVDGPRGGANRELSTKIAAENTDFVLIHDAEREFELKWQEKYLKSKFHGPEKGGSRCNLWEKESANVPKTIIPRPVLTVEKPQTPLEPSPDTPESANMPQNAKKRQFITIVFNGRGEGGAERSVTWMMNKLTGMGHKVTYHTPDSQPCETFKKTGNKNISVEGIQNLNESCDVLMLYANDWIWEFEKPEIQDIFSNINASRKVLCVNFKINKIGITPWTKGWDKYLFLNNSWEEILLQRYPEADTQTFAPPTDLTKFYDIIPDYSKGIRLIRHSSQGDSKYPKTFNTLIRKILDIRKDITIRLMPAPGFLDKFDERVFIHQRNVPAVEEYLKLGNCFWYLLPEGYTEGGPKVIMEAQAAGLPVIADNHSGMKDRIIEKTGWLCNSPEEHLKVIGNISTKDLEEYGKNAKEHARKAYNPMNWIEAILG